MTIEAQPTNPATEEFHLSEEELGRLWKPQGLDMTPLQADLLPQLRQWLDRRRGNPLAGFLIGKPVIDLPKTITKDLTAEVLARFRPQISGVAVVSLLTKIIDRGNALGLFSLCPPPIAVLVRRQPSPFRADRWPMRDVAPGLRLLLAKSSNAHVDFPQSEGSIERHAKSVLGEIFVSSLVHGGQIALASLIALARRLQEPSPPLDCIRERLFIELSLHRQNQEGAEFRRWFPDALSAALIMRLKSETVGTAFGQKGIPDERMPHFVWRCICYFVCSIDDKFALPNTLNRLLDAVQLDLESQLPSYLVNYAARTFISHSLRADAYRRLHGLVADPSPASEISQLGPPGYGIGQDATYNGDVEPRWLHGLRMVIKGDDRDAIVQGADNLLNSAEPGFQTGEVGELFLLFARRVFARSNSNKVRMAVSTCRAYVLTVSVRLGGLVGHDVSQFDSHDWGGLYEEALSDAETPSIRQKLVRALREFQHFLEVERQASPLEAKEIFAASTGLVPVDANVVSEHEFLKIQSFFSEGVKPGYLNLTTRQDGARLCEIAWLVVTLSYRCGLRRMEVLKLELADLLLGDRLELLVRPTKSRGLKSVSSTRKLPLHALLETAELDRLRRWAAQRAAEESDSAYSQFLFSLPKSDFRFVPQDTLFPLIHKVMREVTGDASLRFHHLRHSFASRMAVMLAASAGLDTARVLATLPGYAISDYSFFLNARKRLFGGVRPTRRDLWVVASLLGHSGPDVSVEHYVHHLDILLAESLTAPAIAPDIKTVTAAAMNSRASAYRHREGINLDNWIAKLFMKGVESQSISSSRPNVAAAVASFNEDASQSVAVERLDQVWHALHLASTQQKSAAQISIEKGIPIAELNACMNTAGWLCNLTISAKSKAYRHRFIQWTPDRREPEKSYRIACPVKPHEDRDQVVFERLAECFYQTYRLHRDLFVLVVRQYAQAATANFGGLIFASLEEAQGAKDYLQFLRHLGLKNDEIQFICYDITSVRSKQSAAWRKALCLDSSIRIGKKSPANGRKSWASSQLGISPIFDDKSGQKIGSAGFRFLMVMAAIAMKLTPE